MPTTNSNESSNTITNKHVVKTSSRIQKKLWSLINNTISKVKHKGSIIPFITVEGINHTQPKDIPNHFGRFFLTLGPH